jgi:hypothetical protein
MSSGYVVLTNALSSGHCHDNLVVINEDISSISVAIKEGARTIEEFDRELSANNTGHWVENNTIRLQIAIVIFDKEGRFERIDF